MDRAGPHPGMHRHALRARPAHPWITEPCINMCGQSRDQRNLQVISRTTRGATVPEVAAADHSTSNIGYVSPQNVLELRRMRNEADESWVLSTPGAASSNQLASADHGQGSGSGGHAATPTVPAQGGGREAATAGESGDIIVGPPSVEVSRVTVASSVPLVGRGGLATVPQRDGVSITTISSP